MWLRLFVPRVTCLYHRNNGCSSLDEKVFQTLEPKKQKASKHGRAGLPPRLSPWSFVLSFSFSKPNHYFPHFFFRFTTTLIMISTRAGNRAKVCWFHFLSFFFGYFLVMSYRNAAPPPPQNRCILQVVSCHISEYKCFLMNSSRRWINRCRRPDDSETRTGARRPT